MQKPNYKYKYAKALNTNANYDWTALVNLIEFSLHYIHVWSLPSWYILGVYLVHTKYKEGNPTQIKLAP